MCLLQPFQVINDLLKQVADLLNEASLATADETSRLASLRQIQNLILVKNPDLLDNFLDVNNALKY
jgi:hypothetical protein